MWEAIVYALKESGTAGDVFLEAELSCCAIEVF